MTITHKSAKQKGNRLQNYLRVKLLSIFNTLEPDDITCPVGSENGTDIKLSPLAKKEIPFSFECKNQERISIWTCLKQAEKNTKLGTDPVLVFKRNNTKTYAVIDLDLFLKLIKNNK